MTGGSRAGEASGRSDGFAGRPRGKDGDDDHHWLPRCCVLLLAACGTQSARHSFPCHLQGPHPRRTWAGRQHLRDHSASVDLCRHRQPTPNCLLQAPQLPVGGAGKDGVGPAGHGSHICWVKSHSVHAGLKTRAQGRTAQFSSRVLALTAPASEKRAPEHRLRFSPSRCSARHQACLPAITRIPPPARHPRSKPKTSPTLGPGRPPPTTQV